MSTLDFQDLSSTSVASVWLLKRLGHQVEVNQSKVMHHSVGEGFMPVFSLLYAYINSRSDEMTGSVAV